MNKNYLYEYHHLYLLIMVEQHCTMLPSGQLQLVGKHRFGNTNISWAIQCVKFIVKDRWNEIWIHKNYLHHHLYFQNGSPYLYMLRMNQPVLLIWGYILFDQIYVFRMNCKNLSPLADLKLFGMLILTHTIICMNIVLNYLLVSLIKTICFSLNLSFEWP